MSDISNNTAEAANGGRSAVAAAREVAGNVAGKVKDAGSNAAHFVWDRYHHLSEDAHHAYDAGRDTAQKWEQSAEQYVKNRPMKALLIAAGIGILIGVLWKRKD
jgi:ElaB/YqjD/DUF883 family membrane-anchored ribosome-binding protein